ncbi:MAG TPA: IS200/IS605 family transposase [Planctomycetaceae bacterium]|nr:IS200/IS605 family transposase [Planctomycetaceae bacterium]
MPDVFLSMHCHVAFGTKDGQPLLRRSVAERLPEQLTAIISDQGAHLVVSGIMPDHLHLLVAFSRLTAVDDLVREVKNRSAEFIRNTFPDQGRFAWQSGYGAFSVSFSNLERVRDYLLDQEELHRERSFQEEFTALLRRHQLAHDEHFYWW